MPRGVKELGAGIVWVVVMECEEQPFNLSGCGVMAAALDLKSKELFCLV